MVWWEVMLEEEMKFEGWELYVALLFDITRFLGSQNIVFEFLWWRKTFSLFTLKQERYGELKWEKRILTQLTRDDIREIVKFVDGMEKKPKAYEGDFYFYDEKNDEESFVFVEYKDNFVNRRLIAKDKETLKIVISQVYREVVV